MGDRGDLASAGEVVPEYDVALPERGQRHGGLLVVYGVVAVGGGDGRRGSGVVLQGRRGGSAEMKGRKRGGVAGAVILLWAG